MSNESFDLAPYRNVTATNLAPDNAALPIYVYILVVAFAAFCIWLGVRIVNRHERWAKWAFATVKSVPILYVLSVGPANWLIVNAHVEAGCRTPTFVANPEIPSGSKHSSSRAHATLDSMAQYGNLHRHAGDRVRSRLRLAHSADCQSPGTVGETDFGGNAGIDPCGLRLRLLRYGPSNLPKSHFRLQQRADSDEAGI